MNRISHLNKKSHAIVLGLFLTAAIMSFVSWRYYLSHLISYVWVMDTGDRKNESYLVKMCPNGKRLGKLQFGYGVDIGYDPVHHIIWASEAHESRDIPFDQLVRVDTDGRVVDRIQGYGSNILAVSPNDGSVWAIMSWEGDVIVLAKIASDGRRLASQSPGEDAYTLALDPRDDSLWIGGRNELMHLSPSGKILFETREVGFFSYAPHQIAVNPTNGDVWFTTGIGVIRMSSDGNILHRFTIGPRDSTAIALHPRDGGVWVANYNIYGKGSVVKLNQEGKTLFDMQTPQHALSVGINPYDGTVWVGIEGGIILLDQNGQLIDVLTGFNKPMSFAFEKSENQAEAIYNCTINE